MLAALAERRPIENSVALVVAHPDDETLAAGGSLHLFRRLLLIHVTDGAPRRRDDAARAGFATPAAYAAARAAELAQALALSGASLVTVSLGIPDQDATAALPTLTATLHALCDRHGVTQIITHPYEGGHPDHDAIACAVQHLEIDRFEFAGYHANPTGGLQTNTFLTNPTVSQCEITLPPTDQARKRAMLACFRTQQAILSQFDTTTERFRPAPTYDFAAPPHPGRLLYEEWGWMSGVEWRRCAA